jgi:hypothetical protein
VTETWRKGKRRQNPVWVGHETVRKEAGDSDLPEGDNETEPVSGPIKRNNCVTLILSTIPTIVIDVSCYI